MTVVQGPEGSDLVDTRMNLGKLEISNGSFVGSGKVEV